MKFYSQLFLLTFLFFSVVHSAPSDSCTNIHQEVELRKQHLTTFLQSLNALLGGTGAQEVPLSVLFQVDFTNADQVAKRKTELSTYENPEAIKKLPEFSAWIACAKSVPLKTAVDEVISVFLEVNHKKLDFFNLDGEKRKDYANSYEASRRKGESDSQFSLELQKSQIALEKAQKDLLSSEVQSAQGTTVHNEDILIARSAVEKYLVDIESEYIFYIHQLKEKKDRLNNLQQRVSALATEVQGQTAPEVSGQFQQVNTLWEEAVDSIFQVFSHVDLKTNYQIPEPLGFSGADSDDEQKNYEEYVTKYKKARDRTTQLSQHKSDLLNQLKAQNFKLLSDVGSMRAALLSRCDRMVGCERARGLTNANIENIAREIKVLPLRYMAGGLSKWLEIKAKFVSGVEGWLDISRQSLILIVLFLIPFFLIKLLNWSSQSIDTFRKNLLSRSMLDYRRRTQFAVWIARLNPFLPSVGMVIAVMVARSLLETTDLKEFSSLLFYAQIYFIYKTFRILLKIFLEVVFSTDSVDKIKEQKLRIEKSARSISRLIFIEYALLHFIEDTVRRALIYNLVQEFIFWLNVFFIFYETNKWRQEIKSSFAYRFPALSQRLQGLDSSSVVFLFLPLLFGGIVIHDTFRFVSSHLLRLDMVKRVLSEVLRRRLESEDVVSKVEPPQEYLDYFDYYMPAKKEFFVDRDISIAHTIHDSLIAWLNHKPTDDLVVIVGNRGMGKTTTLNRIYGDLPPGTDALFERVKPKILSQKHLYVWLSEITGTSITSVQDFKNWDKNLTQKKIFFIDDIQNLFIGKIGGFSAYETFIDVISLRTQNVFWCLTVNSQSWAFLRGIFGQEHFYGRVVELKPWRDYEIQRLILARHSRTDYQRTFDDSIRAYGAGESVGQQAEAQFFRLLWGQSRGNPRSALMYWVSAVSSPSRQHIHVGVPSFVSSSAVSTMSDDALFILAAIARHDSLTHEELQEITGIPDNVIRKCIKEAHDKNLVWSDKEERIRISSRAQYVVDYFLIGKNFLYE